jgi:hypothetical protein
MIITGDENMMNKSIKGLEGVFEFKSNKTIRIFWIARSLKDQERFTFIK